MPTTFSPGPVFIGREREMAGLRAAFDEVRAGRGRLVLLAGEPGIGKTRTCEQLASIVRQQGGRVLWGRCYEDEGAPAFWPWLQVLRAALKHVGEGSLRALMTGTAELAHFVAAVREGGPEVAQLPRSDSADARFRLFDSIARLFGTIAEQGPLVIVLDDLHGADPSSLLLLEFIARSLRDVPMFVLGTGREVGLRGEHVLSQVFVDLAREPATERLLLRGLSEPEVAEYVRVAVGVEPSTALASLLHQRTEGNPLFVGEFVRAIAQDGLLRGDGADAAQKISVPQSVHAVILRRLAPLSAMCRQVLGIAAVIGREFASAPVASVLMIIGAARTDGQAEEAAVQSMEEAAEAGMIAPLPNGARGHRFAHALIRETLYDVLRVSERMQLHRAVGEAIERLPGVDAHLSELAYHFLEAGQVDDADKAVRYALRAAERAMALLAYEEAARLLTLGLTALERTAAGDERLRCELLLRLGEAHQKAGNTAANKESIVRAADLARTLGDSASLARAALSYGQPFALGEGPEYDPALVHLLRDALSAIGPAPSATRTRLLSRLSTAVRFADPPGQQEPLSREAVDVARLAGSASVLAQALTVRHAALEDIALTAERLAIASELVDLAEQNGEDELAFQGHGWRIQDRLELGDPGALDEIDVCTYLATKLKQPLYDWQAALIRGARLLIEGRWREFDHLAEQALQVGRGPIRGAPYAFCIQSLVTEAVRTRRDQLVQMLSYAADAYPYIPGFRHLLAYVYLENGEIATLHMQFERLATDDFANLRRDANWAYSTALAAILCAAVKDTRRAAILYQSFHPYRGRTVVIPYVAVYMGPVAYYLGILAALRCEWEAATEHFEAALAMDARLGAIPFTARTQCEYARMLLARAQVGDTERAQSLLRDALATARKLDILLLIERVRALQDGASGFHEVGDRASSVFRREGEYWTIAYADTGIRLRDTKGLQYIGHLLAHSGRDIHVADLVAPAGEPGNGAGGRRRPVEGDLGAVLDRRATAEYKRRLTELREELEEATAAGDIGRADRRRHEIELITREVAAAYGLGGRARKAGDPVERMRKAVTNQIHRAVGKIRAAHPELGRHLANALKTGFACAYRPEQPVAWRF